MPRGKIAQCLIGQKFNRLTVIEFVEINQHKKYTWKCLCECGQFVVTSSNSLKKGNTKSCGCLKLEITGARRRTHGKSQTPEYRNWCAMKERCYSDRHKNYVDYGGRGIRVCDRWLHSFENFLADMGLRPFPKATIDRIEPDGNYEPGNCCWATQLQQARNKRNSRLLTIDGKTMTVSEWAEHTGCSQQQINCRLKRGWTPRDAVMLPKKGRWQRRKRLESA